MRSRLLAALLLAVAVPVGIIACSHELALDDWLSRADATCRAAQQQADANPPPQSPLPGDKLRLTADRSRAELEQLKALDPPAERKSAVAEYLITLDHRIEALGNYAQALDKARAVGPLPDRTSLEEFTTQAYTQAVALGLEDCSGGIDFTVDTTTTTLQPSPSSSTPVPTAVGGQPADEDTGEDQPGY